MCDTASVTYKEKLLVALQNAKETRARAGATSFQIAAYTRAIKLVKEHQGAIETPADLASMKGIGKSILATAQEAFEQTPERDPLICLEQMLTEIPHIGAAKAKQLVREKGIRSLAELVARQEELLTKQQQLGLRYKEDIEKRIPRAEMDKHAAELKRQIETVFGAGTVFEIAGSYRRQARDSGDIDVLIRADSAEQMAKLPLLVEEMKRSGYLVGVLASGQKKAMLISKLKRHRTARRLDVLLTTPETFPYALLYFTGSGDFNVEMRKWALSKGYSLSEYGLKKMVATEKPKAKAKAKAKPKKGKKKKQEAEMNEDEDEIHSGSDLESDAETQKESSKNVIVETEEEIFRFLGLRYVPPSERRAGAIIPLT